ncbi:DUF6924 domain-containing protein [Micromonospora sp. DT178]|uniref:DUF6924 domain-containing protein n=1 Tax=Micromonospora sp. DT178 TaxID=3393436 RepID=UPI003CF43C9C
MAYLPDTNRVPVIRADFSDDALWAQLQQEISKETEEGFGANVEFVEDPRLAAFDVSALVRSFPRAYPHEYNHPVVFVVDAVTVSSPEHPNPRHWPQRARPGRAVPGRARRVALDRDQPLALQRGLFRVRDGSAPQRRCLPALSSSAH